MINHDITIILDEIDCVIAAYPAVATSGNNLKTKCQNAHDEMQIPENESSEWETWHEVLHEVQELATDWCDNGPGGLNTTQMCNTFDAFSAQLP